MNKKILNSQPQIIKSSFFHLDQDNQVVELNEEYFEYLTSLSIDELLLEWKEKLLYLNNFNYVITYITSFITTNIWHKNINKLASNEIIDEQYLLDINQKFEEILSFANDIYNRLINNETISFVDHSSSSFCHEDREYIICKISLFVESILECFENLEDLICLLMMQINYSKYILGIDLDFEKAQYFIDSYMNNDYYQNHYSIGIYKNKNGFDLLKRAQAIDHVMPRLVYEPHDQGYSLDLVYPHNQEPYKNWNLH